MKKLNTLVLGFAVAMGFSGCIDDGDSFDAAAQYELERPIVRQYALNYLTMPDSINILGAQLYYEVVNTGDPASYQYKTVPNPNNPSQDMVELPDLTLIFEGSLIQSNDVVHSNEDAEGDEVSLSRNNLPTAWQAALLPQEIRYDEDGEPLSEPIEIGGITRDGLKAGGIIRIVSPSYLLYGNSSFGNIPANSPMYYEIEVVNIEEPSSNSN